MGRTNLVETSLAELRNKIKEAHSYREKLKKYVSNLHKNYKNGKISYKEYVEAKENKIDGLAPESWIKYYDTYISELNFPINYTVYDADFVWYNLDEGTNKTLLYYSSTNYFNTTNGLHTLYLYANNSNGLTSKNVTFFVNSSKFIVIYNNFFGSSKGSSTDFNKTSYEELQNLSDLTFENTNYGKITFFNSINITNLSGNFVNFDANVNILNNQIEINSTLLSNLNVPANLSLYGLSFISPRILKDGVACSSSECTLISYSGGILRFNGSGFSVYSAEETASNTTIIVTSGGGGGGGRNIIQNILQGREEFSVNETLIKVSLKQREVEYKKFLLTNNLDSNLTVSIELQGLEEMATMYRKDTILTPKKSEILHINFFASEETKPDIYFGNIVLKTENSEKKIPVVMIVSTKYSLFDLEVNIPDKYKKVYPGDVIIFTYELTNLGDLPRVDVHLNYGIKSLNGTTFINQSKYSAVETTLQQLEELQIPEEIEKGKYLLFINANYDGSTAIGTQEFHVVGKASLTFSNNWYYILGGVILFSALVIFLIIRAIRRNIYRALNKNLKKKR